MSSPHYVEMHVDGVLDMANFKHDDHKCRIEPAIGAPVICTFTPELADTVHKLLRQTVRAIGRAKIIPHTNRVEHLELKALDPLPSIASGKGNFFQDATLAQLADIQKVKPLGDPRALEGAIPDDIDVDAFLDVIYSARK